MLFPSKNGPQRAKRLCWSERRSHQLYAVCMHGHNVAQDTVSGVSFQLMSFLVPFFLFSPCFKGTSPRINRAKQFGRRNIVMPFMSPKRTSGWSWCAFATLACAHSIVKSLMRLLDISRAGIEEPGDIQGRIEKYFT